MASKKKNRAPKSAQPAPAQAQPMEKATVQARPGGRTGSQPPRGGGLTGREMGIVAALSFLFFLVTCIVGTTTQKAAAMVWMLLAVGSCLLRFSKLRERLSLPLLAVAAWVMMNGISTLYAVSGKFALREFLRILAGFCLFLIILAWERSGRDLGRTAAGVLTGGTALASLISIDMISTHFLSGPMEALLTDLDEGFEAIFAQPVEVGVRLVSIYENPNVFAGVTGLAVLLGLGLAVTALREGERRFHLVCLFFNSLAFLLAFSMGASGVICVAFLLLLILEGKHRGELLVLMVETLILAVAGAFPIFLTSFEAWDGIQPVPLLCAVCGGVLLCGLDRLLGNKLAARLEQAPGKALAVVMGGVVALVALFAVAAVNVTGPAQLQEGDSLRRSAYPQSGSYTLEVEGAETAWVSIQSQNEAETMMHTRTTLYEGPAQNATFTVPEGSLVTHFTFAAQETPVRLDRVSFTGEQGSGELKLHYKLLPGFIANRLQGLFANENAIQRTVFFADGLSLFRRSPVFGLGLGGFENSVQSVQQFHYETKYVHNHYIESLVSTGIVGLVLFVGMLGLCLLALLKNLRRGEESQPLAPALVACLVFMAGHACVEVVFSSGYYLPMALGVLALSCLLCGEELPLKSGKEELRSGLVVALLLPMVAFGVLLQLNVQAKKIVVENTTGDTGRSLAMAAKMDVFERNDYMLSYVYMAKDLPREANWSTFTKANDYAQKLMKEDSNTIPLYLAQYYFYTEQPEQAVAALQKYVDFLPANSEAWQRVFELLEDCEELAPELCRETAEKLYDQFHTWQEEHMGQLELTADNQKYIDGILSEKP